MQILEISTEDEIANCFEVFLELRPHLKNKEKFTETVLLQMKDGYKIIAIKEGDQIASCAGYRYMQTLSWGKFIYIDDLITQEKSRGKGYGAKLLQYVINEAKNSGCNQVHLDSGHARFDAHKLYLQNGFKITCHHFGLEL